MSTNNSSPTSPLPSSPLSPSESLLEDQLARILSKIPLLIRLPKPGTRCPHCQLSRTGLNELVAPTERNGGKPPVEAIYQRAHKYAQRGTWLIPAENLFRYLLSLSTSSVEEYQKADALRLPDGDDDSVSQKQVSLSRITRKIEKKLPSHPAPRSTNSHAKERAV